MEKLCLNASDFQSKSRATRINSIRFAKTFDGFNTLQTWAAVRMPITDRHSSPARAGLSIIPPLLRLKKSTFFLSN